MHNDLNNDFFNPTIQTRFDKDGNCLSACIATLFNVSIDKVPWFEDENTDWIYELSEWMIKKFNKYVCPVKFDYDSQIDLLGNSLIITSINSPNPNVKRHAVITQNYKVIFDPMFGECNYPIVHKDNATFLLIGDVRLKTIKGEN